ncbi:MAG: hypothetical protein MEP57_05835 [Microvirga sp.]|nr:hypothetical protein [Microvirga sp.]
MNNESTSAGARIRAAGETPSFARAALGFSGSIALLCAAVFALSVF